METRRSIFPFREEFEKKSTQNDQIEAMQAKCRETFDAEPPNGYIAFLYAKDGFHSKGLEAFEAQNDFDNQSIFEYLDTIYQDYWIVAQAEKEARYFFVGRSGGGSYEWSTEQDQYVKLPWKADYAYDYKTRCYVAPAC